MRRVNCKVWACAVGIAVAMTAAGCGGGGASSPSVDPKVAFTQYDEASKAVECSNAGREMDDAARDRNFGIMKNKAFQYRDLVAPFDDQLDKIAFPAPAQPIARACYSR